MNVDKFVLELQEKYHYSEEMVSFLKQAIPAIVIYYGEDKLEIIMGALRDTEIHIQNEGENTSDYLNEYFGTNQKWQIPPMAGAFQHTQVSLKEGIVSTKNIIYIGTTMLHTYTPFDYNNDSKISSVIHEICHAIKGYRKLKVENNQVVVSTGLLKEYYDYDSATNTFINIKSDNVGLEEALNSYDEAEIMSIMTGVKHKVGAYKSLTSAARCLLDYKGVASAIKKSQFSDGNEWIEYLGPEVSSYLSTNFDDMISGFYNYKDSERTKRGQADFLNFIRNYTDPLEYQNFEQARKKADAKTLQMIEQIVIRYNSETNQFIEEAVNKSL